MTVSYEWGPDDSAWTILRDVFALPLNPIPGWARSGRAFAGRNPLKWALLTLGALGYLVGIVIYWLFALLPAGSYVFLRILTAPMFVAVYVVKAVSRLHRAPSGSDAGLAIGPTGPAAAPRPPGSTRRRAPSPG